MYALIEWAAVNGLEVRSELRCVLGTFVGFEGRLILPRFNDDEAVGTRDLLNHIDG